MAATNLNCSICQANSNRYKCPKCLSVTCSLECSKKHKINFNCDGKKSQWTRLKNFDLKEYDNSKLMDDYRFLDTTDSILKKSRTVSPKLLYANIDKKKRILQSQCRRRKSFLKLMPPGLEKSTKNKSYFESFSSTVFWTVQLNFSTVEDYSVTVDGIPDSLTLKTLVKQFLVPRKVGKVIAGTDYDPKMIENYIEIGVDKVEVLMKVEKQREMRYFKLDKDKSIVDNLHNRTLVEFPTFMIIAADNLEKFPILSVEEESKLKPEPFFNPPHPPNNQFKNNQKRKQFNKPSIISQPKPTEEVNLAQLPKLQRLKPPNDHFKNKFDKNVLKTVEEQPRPVPLVTSTSSDSTVSTKPEPAKVEIKKPIDYFRMFGDDFSDSELQDSDSD